MRRLFVGSVVAGLVAAVAVVAGAVAPAAAADPVGTTPTVQLQCGAMRDIPSQWTPVYNEPDPTGTSCAGTNAYAYSFVLTSPSSVHMATWPVSLGESTQIRVYHVEVWVPSYGAGQEVKYQVKTCETGTWDTIGQLDQEADSGWYTPGVVATDQSDSICGIREVNTGPGTWDMAEAALGLHT